MKFDFAEVKEIMKNGGVCLIVKVENVDEYLFLVHGFDIYYDYDDDIASTFTYPCYFYIRKSAFRKGYYRTFSDNDVYDESESKDVWDNKIIRKEITYDSTPKEILLETINDYKSQNGYTACVVADDGEYYLAIDDNTLVGDYGRINIENDLDDDLKFKAVGRIVKIFTANIISLSNWVGQNTVWEYDEKR